MSQNPIPTESRASAAEPEPEGAVQPKDEPLTPGAHDRVDGGGSGGKAALDFEDDEIGSGRGNTARMGGTNAADGADSGKLGPPGEQLSDRNGPSDRS